MSRNIKKIQLFRNHLRPADPKSSRTPARIEKWNSGKWQMIIKSINDDVMKSILILNWNLEEHRVIAFV